mmetsp:Transcript_38620/g.103019  ORF Transcript_38620/g.103019 Transcript_38620/m.103019 type:complete len:220 (+) Transcript_38620:367-1026(+)
MQRHRGVRVRGRPEALRLRDRLAVEGEVCAAANREPALDDVLLLPSRTHDLALPQVPPPAVVAVVARLILRPAHHRGRARPCGVAAAVRRGVIGGRGGVDGRSERRQAEAHRAEGAPIHERDFEALAGREREGALDHAHLATRPTAVAGHPDALGEPLEALLEQRPQGLHPRRRRQAQLHRRRGHRPRRGAARSVRGLHLRPTLANGNPSQHCPTLADE